ncbi:hypothetical protein [Achromobacter xylosoxidans]|uniref:hypothetical protein n=1 Tax=Alcaligenes xylosoxydans xylosoxydans TaxID=85698 RepID=UPI001F13CB4B|nr:hypothetical protein [Achromobacter xylosoxidans]
MNNRAKATDLDLADDEIEALALKHIAPGYERLRAVVPEFAPYQDSEQFRRVKALLAEAQHRLRAPVGEDRDIWLVCLSREYYNGGDRPLLAVPSEAMAQQIAADLQQYCRDLRERLDANNWQHEADPEIASKLYEESEALLAAAQFPHGVKLARYDLDDDFSIWSLALIGASAALASAPGSEAGNWQQYRLRGSNENAEQIIERERRAYADLLQSVMDKRRDQASAAVAREAQAAIILNAVDEDGPLLGWTKHWVEYPIGTKFYAAPQASAEPLVRYCPGCGSVGPVESEYRDCCPDGGEARIIPAPLAEKCRDTFKIAVKALRADAAANEAMANQVPAVTEEYTLRAMARNYTDRHSWDKLDSKAITAAADEIRALRAALAARAQLPERGDAHD